MNNLDKLITHFEKFPGIGGRQARRFAFHILTMPQSDVAELTRLIGDLPQTVIECVSCRRFFSHNGTNDHECRICLDPNRDRSKLMVVERDSDVQAIERAGIYDGMFFVLGGTVPLLDSHDSATLRGSGLKHIVEQRLPSGLQEIILAFSVNPDGENTGRFVESILRESLADTDVSISYLGRGLSTGSELEYADPYTIKNAWENRVSPK